MRKIFYLFLCFSLFSCQESKWSISEATGNSIPITDEIPQNDSLNEFIEPYKLHIDEEMNAVLAYSAFNLNKKDGNLNTAIGNMMADAVMELSSPVFEKRTGDKIDVVLLNHGGIRSTINQGDVTTRTAYQVMPFENEVVVAELEYEQMQELFQYLKEAQTPHPISGLKLALDENAEISEALVQGKPLERDKTYFVATSDYLLNGGDNMNFFKARKSENFIDYKIRNLLIDYFKKKDTIAPVKDERFIILKK